MRTQSEQTKHERVGAHREPGPLAADHPGAPVRTSLRQGLVAAAAFAVIARRAGRLGRAVGLDL